MSYTPPSGDAAELRFSSVPYTPPSGDAADLTFGEGGIGEGSFYFSGAADGAHGVVSDAVGTLYLSGDSLSALPPCAIALYNLSLLGSGDASHPNFAFGSEAFVIKGSAGAVTAVAAETLVNQNQLVFAGEAWGGIPPYGEGYALLVIDGAASASVLDSYQGTGAGTLVLSGTSLGFYTSQFVGEGLVTLTGAGGAELGNTSSASGTMVLLGLGNGERGVVSSAAGATLLNGDGAAFTGAPSTAAGELLIQGAGEASHGRSASASDMLLIFGGGEVAVGMAGSATGLLGIFGAGGVTVPSVFSAEGLGALRFFGEAASPSVDVPFDTLHILKPSDNRIVVLQ